MNNLIQYLPENKKGKDYLVGDLHGCFSLLQQKLDEIKFNPQVDRLISTGDLIDRGDEILECLELLNKPWFFAVQGNHERMLLAQSHKLASLKLQIQAQIYSGKTIKLIKQIDLAEQAKILNLIGALPLVIKVQTPNPYYVLHGERIFNKKILTNAELEDPKVLRKYAEKITWGRNNLKKYNKDTLPEDIVYVKKNSYKAKFPALLKDISLTYVGHSIVPHHILYQSHFYLDRGAYVREKEYDAAFDLSIWEHEVL